MNDEYFKKWADEALQGIYPEAPDIFLVGHDLLETNGFGIAMVTNWIQGCQQIALMRQRGYTEEDCRSAFYSTFIQSKLHPCNNLKKYKNLPKWAKPT